MKKKNVLLRVIVILLIMIVSLISFFGIYKRNLNSWENILPDYNFGKDLGESSVFGLRVDTSTKTVEDESADNNEEKVENTETNNTETNNTDTNNTNNTEANNTESGTTENKKETPKKQVPVNDASALNKENYKKSKEIVEKRLKEFEVIDSAVSFNEENGEMTISVPRGEAIDYVPELVSMQGKIEIVDTETKEVVIDRSMITKTVTYYLPVGQSDNDSGQTYEIGIRVYFNSEGKKKLNEISKKYIETTDEEGKATQKTITTRINDQDRHITYFPEDFSLDYLPVRLYSSITVKDGDMTQFNESYREAFVCQVAINAGELPVVYTVVPGTYFANTSGEGYVEGLIVGTAIVLAVVSIIMLVKFKGNGLKAVIIELGYTAIVLLLVRAASVIITLSGFMMILFMLLLNYVLLAMFMNKEKVSEFGRFALNMIPFIITILVFNFATDINLQSVGMIGVWGLITFAYTLITSIILLDNRNTKKNGVEKNEE